MNKNRSEPKLLSTLLNPIKLLAHGAAPVGATCQEPKPLSILRYLRKTVNTKTVNTEAEALYAGQGRVEDRFWFCSML